MYIFMIMYPIFLTTRLWSLEYELRSLRLEVYQQQQEIESLENKIKES